MEKKIILILIVPIVKYFDLDSKENNFFFDIRKINRNFLSKKIIKEEKDIFHFLENIEKNEKVMELIKNRKEKKIIFTNYPKSKEEFISFNKELEKINLKINSIIIVDTINYDLVENLMKKYLICPICEKIFLRDENNKKKYNLCPNDEDIKFSQEILNKINIEMINYYFHNSKNIIELFLKNNSISNIQHIKIRNIEELFSEKIENEILKIINK